MSAVKASIFSTIVVLSIGSGFVILGAVISLVAGSF